MGHGAVGGGATRLGVFCAIVLVALLALLHGSCTPGVGLPAEESDAGRCTEGILRQVLPPFVGDTPADGSMRAGAPSGDTGGEHEPAVGTARTGATPRPRYTSSAGSCAPVVVEGLGIRPAGSTEAGE
ncbi:hypothetical protein, partial [Streptomyces sp. SID3343]|uniref:hypothetical protein n=1 Tax=Streptomyces sp. SID3343 TaxID=2690260 RepID=UPI0013716F47